MFFTAGDSQGTLGCRVVSNPHLDGTPCYGGYVYVVQAWRSSAVSSLERARLPFHPIPFLSPIYCILSYNNDTY